MQIQGTQRKLATSIPQPVLIGEAMFLHRWCSEDREQLIQSGLNWNVVESLPHLCNHCDSLYAQYTIAKAELSTVCKKLKNSFLGAKRVRSLIAKRIRHALEISGFDKKIPSYSKRRAYPEIIADLRAVAALCIHFKEYLGKTGFRVQRAGAVTKCADVVEKKFLYYQKTKLEYRDLKKQYLIAYRKVYTALQQIRQCAFSIFPAGTKRRSGYISQYKKNFY